MRAIFALAFLAFVAAGPLKDDPVEVIAAKKFINECIRKVLIDGLPSAHIPSHEPLKFHKNYSIPIPIPSGRLHLNNVVMEGIPEFELREVVSHPENNANGVFFDYNIYWKSMVLRSQYEVKVLGLAIAKGEQSMSLNHVTFAGIWNMTNAQGMEQTLDNFSVNIENKSVDVVVTNTPFDGVWEKLGPIVNQTMNSPVVSKVLSSGLLKKFNKDWMQKGERIDAMLQYCWPKY